MRTTHLRLALSAFLAFVSLTGLAADPPATSAADVRKAAPILGDKPSRTAVERKIDADLVFAMRAVAQQQAGALVQVPPFVQSFIDREVAADNTVFVVIKGTVSRDLVGFLAGLGARDVSEFAQYDTITARVPIGSLEAIAERADVKSVGQRERARTNRYVPSADEQRRRLQALGQFLEKSGTVQWQGVAAHRANTVQSSGVTGSGVKVCVLSDGVDSLALRQAGGELPAVSVLSGQAGSGDEGTAMLEIVHDMAPGASLGFATAFNGIASFATNIQNLRSTLGCDVIVDDVSYSNEGAFQDGPIAQAVANVTAAGALYFSAAGNSGSLTHASSGTYEGDFVASAAQVPASIAAMEGPGTTLMSFGGSPYLLLTAATYYVGLQWSDPLGGSGNDYDLFVTDRFDNVLCNAGTNGQSGAQDAFELAYCSKPAYFPAGSRIYVVLYSGQPRAIRVDAMRGTLNIGTTGSTYGHNAAASAFTVAAVDLADANGGAFVGGAANPVEWYSSDGPRKMFYTSAGTAITPGNILFATNGGTTLPKVDIAAGDCGNTATAGFTVFCGTSAAAPTAAAIAALVKSAKPSATAAQVANALRGSALDIEAPGTDRDSGVGIVMATTAVNAVLTPLTLSKSFSPATVAVGQPTVLSIQVGNPNAFAMNGVAFTDTFPGPIRATATPGAAVTGLGCAASLSAPAAGGSFVISGASIPAGGTCTFTVNVSSVSDGVIADSSGALSTSFGPNTGGASATLTATFAGLAGEANVALATTGATVTASSTASASFPAASLINGDRAGLNWGNGGGWKDATSGVFPDSVEIALNGAKQVDRVVVYSLQDTPTAPSSPTPAMTFSSFGVTDFTVEGWNGTGWTTLGTVTGNNLVKRTVYFSPFTTDRIRVTINNALGGYSRLVEIEAYGLDAAVPPVTTNVALASAGTVASASSSAGSNFPVASLTDGDRRGVNWGSGGGWKDSTSGVYPDWVELDFNQQKTIDRVVVYSVQDNPSAPVEPTDGMTFTSFGVTDFVVQGWSGSGWVTLATVTGNNLVKRTVSFAAFTTNMIRVSIAGALNNYSRLVEIEAWTPQAGVPTNVALASAGASVFASSTASASFPAASLINGDRMGVNWGSGGGWKDATSGAYPDWVEVDFASASTIDHVVVYSLQDNPSAPVEPSDTMTFASFGVTDFTVQGWDGANWVTLGSVSGNNRVKRTVAFSAYTTDRIRVNVTNSLNGYSRLVEIEAWTVGGASEVNYALATAGATVSASSTASASFPASSLIDGDHVGLNWGSGGGWKDGTSGVYPDWVEIDFGATKTIDRVVVYSLQDSPTAPVEPTDTMTFSSFGVTDFSVQAWDGAAWVPLGTVSGNNLVKRSVSFAGYATDRIRVNITGALNNYSRLVEIEAWGH